MNHKENDNPGITSPPESQPLTQFELLSLPSDTTGLKAFVETYCTPVYSAITLLTEQSDQTVLENLTGNVLYYLWNNRVALTKEKSSGILILKILLQYVFSYLKKVGNEDRILFLRKILYINPDCYLHIIEPTKKSLFAINQSYLFTKIRKLWKTF
jgi:hypothetical protein